MLYIGMKNNFMKTNTQDDKKKHLKLIPIVRLFCVIWIVVVMFLFVVINGTKVSTIIASHLGLSDVFIPFINWLQPIFSANFLE